MMRQRILTAMKRGPVTAVDFTTNGWTLEAAIILSKMVLDRKCYLLEKKAKKADSYHGRRRPVYSLNPNVPNGFDWPLVNQS